jgi:hypothetical protein
MVWNLNTSDLGPSFLPGLLSIPQGNSCKIQLYPIQIWWNIKISNEYHTSLDDPYQTQSKSEDPE